MACGLTALIGRKTMLAQKGGSVRAVCVSTRYRTIAAPTCKQNSASSDLRARWEFDGKVAATLRLSPHLQEPKGAAPGNSTAFVWVTWKGVPPAGWPNHQTGSEGGCGKQSSDAGSSQFGG